MDRLSHAPEAGAALPLECRECDMTFATASELANHKAKFCIGSEYDGDSVLQKLAEQHGLPSFQQAQGKPLRFGEVKDALRPFAAEDGKPLSVQNMSISDVRSQLQLDPINNRNLSDAQRAMLLRLEKEKARRIENLKEEQARKREMMQAEEKRILELLQSMEQKKEAELRAKLDREKAKRMLQDVDRSHLAALEEERKRELELLEKERQALAKREEEASKAVNDLRSQVVEHERVRRQEEEKQKSAVDARKIKGTLPEEARALAEQKGANQGTKSEKIRQLQAERDAIHGRLRALGRGDTPSNGGDVSSFAAKEDIIMKAKQHHLDASKRIEELRKQMREGTPPTRDYSDEELLPTAAPDEQYDKAVMEVERLKNEMGSIMETILHSSHAPTPVPDAGTRMRDKGFVPQHQQQQPLQQPQLQQQQQQQVEPSSRSQSNMSNQSKPTRDSSPIQASRPASGSRRPPSAAASSTPPLPAESMPAASHAMSMAMMGPKPSPSVPVPPQPASTPSPLLAEIQRLKLIAAQSGYDHSLLSQIGQLEAIVATQQQQQQQQQIPAHPSLFQPPYIQHPSFGLIPNPMYDPMAAASAAANPYGAPRPMYPPPQSMMNPYGFAPPGGSMGYPSPHPPDPYQQYYMQPPPPAPNPAMQGIMAQIQKQLQQSQQLLQQSEEDNTRLQQELRMQQQQQQMQQQMQQQQQQMMMMRPQQQQQQQQPAMYDDAPASFGIVGRQYNSQAQPQQNGSMSARSNHQNESIILTRGESRQQQHSRDGIMDVGGEDELSKLRLDHEREMARIRYEMERLEQMTKLEKLRKDLDKEKQEEERRKYQEEWELNQKRQLAEAKLKRQLAAGEASSDSAIQVPSHSNLPYDPEKGFSLFFDYALGLPKRVTQIQLVYAFYERGSQKTPIKSTPIADGEAQDLTHQRCILAIRRHFVKMAVIPGLKVIIEVQMVVKPAQGPGEVPKLQSIGWSLMEIFDKDGELCVGLWKLPLFWPPVLPMHSPSTIESVAKRVPAMEVFVRLAGAADLAAQAQFVVNPDLTQAKYILPRGFEGSPLQPFIDAPSLPQPSAATAAAAAAPSSISHSASMQPSQPPLPAAPAPVSPVPISNKSAAPDVSGSPPPAPASSSLLQSQSIPQPPVVAAPDQPQQQQPLASARNNKEIQGYDSEYGLGLLLDKATWPLGDSRLRIRATIIVSGSRSSNSSAEPYVWATSVVDMTPGQLGLFEWQERTTFRAFNPFRAIMAILPSARSSRALLNQQQQQQAGNDMDPAVLLSCVVLLEVLAQPPAAVAASSAASASEAMVAWSVLPIFGQSEVADASGASSSSASPTLKFNSGKQVTKLFPPPISSQYLLDPSRLLGEAASQSSISGASLTAHLFSKGNEPPVELPPRALKTGNRESGSSAAGPAGPLPSPGLVPSDAFIAKSNPIPDVPFTPGDGLDVYIDASRLLPENVTISKCTALIANTDWKAICPQTDVLANLDSPCLSPSFGPYRFEVRGASDRDRIDPTATLFLELHTVEKHARRPQVIGYVAFGLFLSRPLSLGTQPSSSTVSDVSACTGAFQLPIRLQGPRVGSKLSSSCLDFSPTLPCSSVLIRVVHVPRTASGAAVAAKGLQDAIAVPAAPLYSQSVYDSTKCMPSEVEKRLYGRRLQVASSCPTGQDCIAKEISDAKLADNNSNAIRELALRMLKRPALANAEPLDLSFVSKYEAKTGFMAAVDAIWNSTAPPKKGLVLHKAIYSLSPPGLYYGQTPLSDGVECTSSYEWDSPINRAGWRDGYKGFTGVRPDPFTVMIIDVRAVPAVTPATPATGTGALDTVPFGWAILPIFTMDGYVKGGQFILPLFAGPVPPLILRALQSEDAVSVLNRALNVGLDVPGTTKKEKIRRLDFSAVSVRLLDGLRAGEMGKPTADADMLDIRYLLDDKLKTKYLTPANNAKKLRSLLPAGSTDTTALEEKLKNAFASVARL